MIQFFKKNIESNKKLRTFEVIVLCLLIFTSIGSVFYGLMQIHKDVGDLQYVQSVTMIRDKDEEDYDSDNKVCDIVYRKGDQKLVVSYDYEDYVKLNKNSIVAYQASPRGGTLYCTKYGDRVRLSGKAALYSEADINIG